MLKDFNWVKLSKNLLTDENMLYIQSQLPKELAAAPYMFYVAALQLADPDGIFDLEDGVIFTSLMKVGTVADCFKIANFMQRRKIIRRVSDESNKCLLCDWDYSKTQKSRTMEERRQIVLKQIEEQKKHDPIVIDAFTADDIKKASEQNQNEVSVDFAKNPAANFFCPENDKIQENVVIKKMDDKIQENVVKKNETEREIDRETELERLDKEIKKETHIEAEDFRERTTGSLQSSTEITALAEEILESTEVTEQSRNIERNAAAPDADDLNTDEPAQLDKVSETQKGQVVGYLQDFFVKNCYGYKPNAGIKAVSEIAERIVAELSNEMNPSDVVAAVLCSEFKKMSDSDGHWKNTPLLPAYMKKPGIWAHLLQRAGKILTGEESKKRFDAALKKCEQEVEAEKLSVGNGINEVYLKYNIDPADPNRFIKLQQVKQAEKAGGN